MALALRGSQQKWETSRLPISLHQFDYSRKDMTEEFLSQLGQLDFLGVSVSLVESSGSAILIKRWIVHKQILIFGDSSTPPEKGVCR